MARHCGDELRVGRRDVAELRQHRVARHRVGDQEDDQRGQQHHERGHEQARGDVAEHCPTIAEPPRSGKGGARSSPKGELIGLVTEAAAAAHETALNEQEATDRQHVEAAYRLFFKVLTLAQCQAAASIAHQRRAIRRFMPEVSDSDAEAWPLRVSRFSVIGY